ncbi:MAG: type II toxin-antitoxin system YafQ family toxin [Burkholderiales bacterium]|nr:type II toxin-antitoxin system YafQ family toxin [Burkholderiales bacterium]
MLELIQTSTFKKSLKKYKHDKKVNQELAFIVDLLINEKTIPEKYKNHRLIGKYDGMLELHLRPDDLLVYFKINGDSITLVAIGSHADLFG